MIIAHLTGVIVWSEWFNTVHGQSLPISINFFTRSFIYVLSIQG